MNRKHYRLTGVAAVLIITGLFYSSQSEDGDTDSAVLELRREGVLVASQSHLPLTGVLTRNRVYVPYRLPFQRSSYSVNISSAQCSDDNLERVMTLAKRDSLTAVAFSSDTVTAVRPSSMKEISQLSACSDAMKKKLTATKCEVVIIIPEKRAEL